MTITTDNIRRYEVYLKENEYAPGTVEKYLRDLRAFAVWLDGQAEHARQLERLGLVS